MKYFFVSYFVEGGIFGNVTFDTMARFPSKKEIIELIKTSRDINGSVVISNIIEFSREQFELFNED